MLRAYSLFLDCEIFSVPLPGDWLLEQHAGGTGGAPVQAGRDLLHTGGLRPDASLHAADG